MNEVLFEKRKESSETLILLPGEIIDNSNVQVLTDELESAYSQGYRCVIVNMSRLEFLSSAGVGVIFSYVRKFREMKGDIVLCNVSVDILYVLNELDVSDYLTISATEETATSECRSIA